jgi:hypothetical protein
MVFWVFALCDAVSLELADIVGGYLDSGAWP